MKKTAQAGTAGQTQDQIRGQRMAMTQALVAPDLNAQPQAQPRLGTVCADGH